MSKPMLAGAAAFVAAPILELVGALVVPTLSDEAPDRVAALLDHRSDAVGGLALQMVALALLVAGTAWLALALARRSPLLAATGGVLAVFSYFVIAFENGVSLAAAGIVTALDPAQATAALKAVVSSAGVSAVEPLSVLGVVGFACLAVALRRNSVSVWPGVALVAGSALETAGFAGGMRALVVAGFAVLAVAATGVVRALAGGVPAPAAAAAQLAEPAR